MFRRGLDHVPEAGKTVRDQEGITRTEILHIAVLRLLLVLQREEGRVHRVAEDVQAGVVGVADLAQEPAARCYRARPSTSSSTS